MRIRWNHARVLIPVVAALCLPGCGGAKAPSPAEQQQKQKDTESSMEKGMEAMKGIKPPKR
ncbi:MAG: hypothetical protein ACKOCW_01940 [Planctomycetaceae bacterium]